jgi:FlaA1/EpsC-like NDP-sugar epimerase
VLGRTEDVRRIVTSLMVDTIIVAMADPPALLIREITRRCEGLKVRLRVAPGLIGLRRENALPAVRDIALEDLLPRREIVTDREEISGYLYGERVLITGAGGSIGAELVRQILAGNPSEIILLGHGENSIFEIEQELRRNYQRVPISLIADIRDYDRLLMLFLQHRPTVVFHAAAHKHVALMENNLEEAITNNVLGTRNLARIAGQTGVKRFVMISTDKAVNPTSIMGVSKRIAEMVVQVESRRTLMELATVRFGNVLGSRGSVIPLMQKQIAQGGPVTVTHPEATRYFMTIPEAVQLVIQSGAMGGRGTIYMLDMGEPVRILDMAHDLIRLAGYTPGKEIPVEIIGLKPGEKLYEELLTAEEGATVTRHQRIYVARPAPFPTEEVESQVEALIQAARKSDSTEILRRIKTLVPDFVGSQAHAITAVPAHQEATVTAGA